MSSIVRANSLLGATNLVVGATWLGMGLLGAFRDYGMAIVVGSLFLAVGVFNSVGAIRQWRIERKEAADQDSEDPEG
jgi:hypothetical protein